MCTRESSWSWPSLRSSPSPSSSPSSSSFGVVPQRDIFFSQVEARLVPARGAGIRAVSRGNCGFVCICKRSLLAGIAGHCAARGSSGDRGPFFRVDRETTSGGGGGGRGPAERVFTHTHAPAGLAAHECGVKQNAT